MRKSTAGHNSRKTTKDVLVRTKKRKLSSSSIVPSIPEDRSIAITRVEYDSLQVAFEHFNAALFSDNPLPNVAIVLECRAHSAGSFAPNRFAYRGSAGGREHKLSLNPDSFAGRDDKSACQTLGHEMHHLWPPPACLADVARAQG